MIRSFRISLLFFSLFALVIFSVLIALGCWQLQRLSWKTELLADLHLKMNQDPVSPDELTRMYQDGKNVDYVPIVFKARFLEDKTALRFYWIHDGRPGWRIIAPVALAAGQIIMLDRGFIPLHGTDHRAMAVESLNIPRGEVHISGLALNPDASGFFVPGNDQEANMWYKWDIPAMIRAFGIRQEQLVPYLVLQEGGGDGLLESLPRQPELKNDHLGYALTWFSLAAVLLCIYCTSVFRALRDKGHRR